MFNSVIFLVYPQFITLLDEINLIEFSVGKFLSYFEDSFLDVGIITLMVLIILADFVVKSNKVELLIYSIDAVIAVLICDFKRVRVIVY